MSSSNDDFTINTRGLGFFNGVILCQNFFKEFVILSGIDFSMDDTTWKRDFGKVVGAIGEETAVVDGGGGTFKFFIYGFKIIVINK